MKKSISTNIVLVIGVLILVSIISNKFFFRLDFTQDNRFSLSQATEDIMESLDEPVTITAYFSEGLPPDIAKTKRDFKELLVEYVNLSDGMVDYEFINPSENEELEKQAMQSGVQPVLINVREKDQVKQQKAFLGAVVQMGEEKEIIPFMKPGIAMEYTLSTSIKKLSIIDKPLIGLIQGHGEPSMDKFTQVISNLSILYNVEPVTLTDGAYELDKYKVVAIVAPADTIPMSHFQQFEQYLAGGGRMFIACNTVTGNFQTVQGTPVYTGISDWLQTKGLTIEKNFVVDSKCGTVGVQQQQGFFNFTSQVQFPYIPIINKFEDHPITKGLEAVVLQFASSISYAGDTSKVFTPIARTSDKSGTQQAPLYFNVNKKWNNQDFPLSNLTVAGVLTGKISGNADSKIVVVGDGDFPVGQGGRQRQQLQPDNVSLMANSIDWLSDDTGLIELRTKGVISRPLEQLEDGTRAFLKYFNFLLPLLIIIVYGVVRMQIRRNVKIRRMQEGYI